MRNVLERYRSPLEERSSVACVLHALVCSSWVRYLAYCARACFAQFSSLPCSSSSLLLLLLTVRAAGRALAEELSSGAYALTSEQYVQIVRTLGWDHLLAQTLAELDDGVHIPRFVPCELCCVDSGVVTRTGQRGAGGGSGAASDGGVHGAFGGAARGVPAGCASVPRRSTARPPLRVEAPRRLGCALPCRASFLEALL